LKSNKQISEFKELEANFLREGEPILQMQDDETDTEGF